VVTTDGMRSALSSRADINSVQIFYPFHYTDFADSRCDLLLIEGWFPSIHSFIALARALTPRAVVLFYCLDPAYPGMTRVRALDVDGFLTNSRTVLEDLKQIRPAMYVPLAADIELMRPDPSVLREYGAVYVGAGGNMLKVKPLLSEMLRRSIPHGLRLHGAHWDEESRLGEAYKGVLPRGALHEAYSSAHAVLACTISSQRDMGMINNRIFEALACGSVVISDYSDILNETFGEVLQFVHEPNDVDAILQQLLDVQNRNYFQRIRDRGRQLIVTGHTWSHRVIEILDFFASLRLTSSTSSTLLAHARGAVPKHLTWSSLIVNVLNSPHIREERMNGKSESRSSVPLLAWIVSEHLTSHPDYLLGVRKAIDGYLQDLYTVHEFTASEWLQLQLNASSIVLDPDRAGIEAQEAALQIISQYRIVLGVMSHFDDLHVGFISFQQWLDDAQDGEVITVWNQSSTEVMDRTQQKYMTYILGVNEEHSREVMNTFFASDNSGIPLMDTRGVYLSDLFDMILFRDTFEKALVASIEEVSYSELLSRYCTSDSVDDETRRSFIQRKTPCDHPTIAKNKMDDIKWQVCFGIWEPAAVDTAIKKSVNLSSAVEKRSSAQFNVALCVWIQNSACTARKRTDVIAPNVNYTLLLVGGTLSGWTSTCESSEGDEALSSCVLDSIPLSRVLHVRDGHVERVTDTLAQATEIFFVYGENKRDDIYSSFSNKDLEGKTTILDVVWPMKFCAVFEKSIRLSEHPSAHMSYLIESDFWRATPVLKQWQLIMSVVLTFGTFKTAGNFVSNYVNQQGGSWHERGELEAVATTDQIGLGPVFSQELLKVYINFKNFVPGLDGQACFFHDDVFSYCRYSREFYLLEMDLHALSWSQEELAFASSHSSFAFVPKSTKLRVELRGYLYLQHFYVIEQIYVLCLANPFNVDDNTVAMSANKLCENGTENLEFDSAMQEMYV